MHNSSSYSQFKALWIQACVVLLIATFAPVFGGPRIVIGSDAEANDIRDAARQFLQAVDNADEQQVKRLLNETPVNTEVTQKLLLYAAAEKKFRVIASKAYGAKLSLFQLGELSYTELLLQDLDIIPFVTTGSRASVTTVRPIDLHLELHKQDGIWRVAGFVGLPADVVRQINYLNDSAALFHTTGQKIEHSALAVEDVVAEFQQKRGELILARFPTNTSEVAAVVRADETKELAISATDISNSLGKTMDADGPAALLSKLPGLPYSSLGKDRAFIDSFEGGLTLAMGALVDGITLYAQSVGGHASYRGEVPLSLSLDMTREDVEKLMGRPIRLTGSDDGVYASYPGQGFSVSYREANASRKNPVSSFTFHLPDRLSPREPPPLASLSFHLVAEPPFEAGLPMYPDPDFPDLPALRIRPEVVLDHSMVESCGISKSDAGTPQILLRFTDAGAQKLAIVTEANIGRRLAIIAGDRVISAPRISTAISKSAVIDSKPTESPLEFYQLVEQLERHRWEMAPVADD